MSTLSPPSTHGGSTYGGARLAASLARRVVELLGRQHSTHSTHSTEHTTAPQTQGLSAGGNSLSVGLSVWLAGRRWPSVTSPHAVAGLSWPVRCCLSRNHTACLSAVPTTRRHVRYCTPLLSALSTRALLSSPLLALARARTAAATRQRAASTARRQPRKRAPADSCLPTLPTLPSMSTAPTMNNVNTERHDLGAGSVGVPAGVCCCCLLLLRVLRPAVARTPCKGALSPPRSARRCCYSGDTDQYIQTCSPRCNSSAIPPLSPRAPSDHRGVVGTQTTATDIHLSRDLALLPRAQSSPSPSVRLFHSLLQWHRHQLHFAQPPPYRNMFLLAAGPSDAPACTCLCSLPMLQQPNCLS
jgi:hypothetical protein